METRDSGKLGSALFLLFFFESRRIEVMTISFIIAPIVGAFIGYITNDIAIRMLFRPYKTKHIFGLHIPFTPGLIPKEKGRIAKSIGDVISENLMNSEVLGQYLLSESITNKLRSSISGFFETQKQNEESVEQFLMHYLTEEEIDGIVYDINTGLTKKIRNKLYDESVGNKISHIVVEHVMHSLSGDESYGLFNDVIGLPINIGRGILRVVFNRLKNSTERLLSRNINEIIKNNGEDIALNLIGDEVNKILNTPVKELLYGKDELIEKIINKVMGLYWSVITESLPRILATIDISKIVCDRINDMDVAELEKLILQVMKKELRAIVWLGAALGFLMGWINVIL